MSLSQRSRTALFLGLTELIADEEAVEEMLSHFPSRDLDEPVTKEFLRAEISDVRAEISDVRAEISDVRAEISDVRAEISGLRAEMHQGFQRLTLALVGSMISLAAVVVTATAVLP
jgi:uncharacterized protein involved in exopolysaccharide biosynthesis